jgi:hypothetical protein
MMQQQSYDIPLHDIKPIVEVQEFSLYYFSALVVVGTLLALFFLYLLFRWIKRKQRFNLRKEYKKLLSQAALQNPKQAAYDITRYGALFQNDTPRHKEMFANLVARLEAYKYKKEVESLDPETIGYYNLYKEMCDV